MSNKTTLSEQIYQELFHDITTQKLIFGQKLTLHDLKNRFQVSQTPVREALTRLIDDGLVNYYSNLGVAVTEFTESDIQKLYQCISELDALAILFCKNSFTTAPLIYELEKIMERCSEGKYVAFAGDGINDAPVITRADIGIAMGSMGSDAAIEAADVVLMEDDISRLASIIRISVKTMKIVRQNIVFALGVKFLVLILGALGQANMWEAVFADVGVAVIAILNAMRANSAR